MISEKVELSCGAFWSRDRPLSTRLNSNPYWGVKLSPWSRFSQIFSHSTGVQGCTVLFLSEN